MTCECTALVVEEPLIRSHLVAMLEENGCKTYQAGSAAEAIAILESNSEIIVVFTDVQMPGTMDGIALAQYVRTLAAYDDRGELRQDSPSGRYPLRRQAL
jgi:CheY-like chemotaxis protein